jgi:hypothetical protein
VKVMKENDEKSNKKDSQILLPMSKNKIEIRSFVIKCIWFSSISLSSLFEFRQRHSGLFLHPYVFSCMIFDVYTRNLPIGDFWWSFETFLEEKREQSD